jgi:drug/metabolite transporter (DMT)-like permease
MNFIELIVLAAIWGASFLFMRVASPELGAFPLAALRVGIASLVLLPFMHSIAARQALRAKAWPLLVVGLTNSAVPFFLLSFSTMTLNAGLSSVLNATTPLWTAAIAALAFQVSMGRDQVIGLVLGFIGVVILVHDSLGTGRAGVPLAIMAAMTATICYGFAVNYSKRHLKGVPPIVVAFGSQFLATVVLAPMGLMMWPSHPVSATAWACVAGLGIFCTAIALVLYFRLVANVGAAFAASVTFLVPLFGLLWGALLGEKITPMMFGGGLIVLLGIAIASGKNPLRRKKAHLQ